MDGVSACGLESYPLMHPRATWTTVFDARNSVEGSAALRSGTRSFRVPLLWLLADGGRKETETRRG